MRRDGWRGDRRPLGFGRGAGPRNCTACGLSRHDFFLGATCCSNLGERQAGRVSIASPSAREGGAERAFSKFPTSLPFKLKSFVLNQRVTPRECPTHHLTIACPLVFIHHSFLSADTALSLPFSARCQMDPEQFA